MNNRIPGLESGLQGEKKKSSGAAKAIKWIALSVIILLAAAMVTASVLYTRFVSVEEGVWIIDLTDLEGMEQEDVDRLRERFPDAVVRRSVDLGGMQVDNDITSLTLNDSQGVSADRLIEAAEELTAVRALNLTGLSVSYEQYERLREVYPEAEIKWTVPVTAFGGLATNTVMVRPESLAALREVVAAVDYLPLLTDISMTDAQLADSELAEVKVLAEQLAAKGIEVTWGIRVAGENYPHNTTEVRFTGACDAAALAELSRLPYLESLTLDNITTGDLSPVTSITTLESLTVCNMNIDDVMVLAGMDWLGAFYVKNTNVTQAQLNRLQDELPECIIMMLE